METFLEMLRHKEFLANVVSTVTLLAAALLLRSGAMRFVRATDWATEQTRLRWTVQVRWAILLLVTLGLIVVWASELRTLALSVVAFAAAVVIATKELILCVSGSVYRATSRCFSVGDRIEIDGIRGDVIDIGAMTTTVLELGPAHGRTGRAVVFPNSLLLAKPITNETFTDAFVLHLIVVPLSTGHDWKSETTRLITIANEICKPFLAEAKKHLDASSQRHGLPPFKVEPVVSLQVIEAGKLNLLLRVPTPARSKGHTEQQILRRFFETAASETQPAV